MSLTKLQKLDYQKFYVSDPNYSPAKNRAVIERTIKKHDKKVADQLKKLHDPYMERADAVIAYLKYADKKPGYALDKFFDKRYLTFLRGDDVRRELYARMQIMNNKGELIKPNF